MTALDFIGVYDPLTRLKTMGFVPEVTWDLCSFTPTASDNTGLTFTPTTPPGAPLSDYDLVVIPGGFGTRKLVGDKAFVEWIASCEESPLKATVCTGSLLLGAAGSLKDMKATTHPTSYGDLAPYCKEVLDQRIVDEGHIITARGVTSALDLGLYLCKRIAGDDVKELIRKQMDYSGCL
jgi:cyclohexyl-isocyanide hydratase